MKQNYVQQYVTICKSYAKNMQKKCRKLKNMWYLEIYKKNARYGDSVVLPDFEHQTPK